VPFGISFLHQGNVPELQDVVPSTCGAQAETAPHPDSPDHVEQSPGPPWGCAGLNSIGESENLSGRTLCEYIRTVASEFERLGLGSFDLSQVAYLNDPVHGFGGCMIPRTIWERPECMRVPNEASLIRAAEYTG